MNIETKRIKGTPYKVVIHNGNILGMFEYNLFIHRKNFVERHNKIARMFEVLVLKK